MHCHPSNKRRGRRGEGKDFAGSSIFLWSPKAPALRVSEHDAGERWQSRGLGCKPPITMSRSSDGFDSLGVSPWLCTALRSMDIRSPTPVQRSCIPPALAGRDVIGAAQTGTGKTVAFALPILQAIAEDPYGICAVVLTPTRELAFQISQQVRALGAQIALRSEVVVGGIDELTQAAALDKRPHVVIATPGRLAMLVERAHANGANLLGRARFLVVDEADRLLEAEYLASLLTILGACSSSSRQTMLFSATMTPCIEKLQSMALQGTDAFRFDASKNRFATVETLNQAYAFMPGHLKETYLVHLLKTVRPQESCIVFTARCDTAEHLTTMLRVLGMRRVAAMHSEMKQVDRVEALQKLKGGTIRALVSTDVASRGLDIPSVEMIINYDLPRKTSTYVHRVGRTARAGRDGVAISFVTQSDVELLHAIEHELDQKLPKFDELGDSSLVMSELSLTLKARQVAHMEISDNGFMGRYDARREEARNLAKKRRRADRRREERVLRKRLKHSDRSSASPGIAPA
jgi:ATP-dependent RNA helicase DDX49/DBP8